MEEHKTRQEFIDEVRMKITDLETVVEEKVEEQVAPRVRTYFLKNNRKLLKAVGICLVGASIQILHKKTKTQGSKIELLNMENQFLHFVISGLSNPDVDATEFNKEIARRANYVQIVSAL